MSGEVPTLREGRRGCGYRKPGGIYLVSDGEGEDCSKLPIELTVCPTCSQGIKPTRGWSWIDPSQLVEIGPHGTPRHSAGCPFSTGIDRAGLLWIGGQFYTPAAFIAEAGRMGISRRIAAIPNDFEVGQFVLLAHREAEWKPCGTCADHEPHADCPECDGDGRIPVAAIFYAFQPQRIEYVVRKSDTEKDIERWRKRGVRPVHVEPIEEQGELEA